MFTIIPALLEHEKQQLQQEIALAVTRVNRLHIDVIEAQYAPNQTVLPEEWGVIPFSVNLGVHLMVTTPLDWIDRCLKAVSTTIIAQVEMVADQQTFIETVLAKKGKAGLALDLDSSIETVDKVAVDQLSIIVLMAVKAGFSGQPFSLTVLDKIKAMRQLLGDNAEIMVDGGINLETAQLCKQAGADGVLVNSYLWQDFETNLGKLQQLG